MKVKLTVTTSGKTGNLVNVYRPLQNLIHNTDNEGVIGFDTDKIQFDLNHPLEIECQPSYDNSVNLIMVDDKNTPLLINSGFSVKENNTFEIVNRNQIEITNIYDEDKLEQQSKLFRNLTLIPRFELNAVTNDGILKGGNYTFYLRLADNDYNKSDIVAESGIVSIFKGDTNNIKGISGTLMDEVTNKAIKFNLKNIDVTFSKVYLSYKRSYCDLNGILMEEYKEITDPYTIDNEDFEITINGYEPTTSITETDLNIQYNIYNAVKTQAQVQNMLFFGNVQEAVVSSTELQQLAYQIKVQCANKQTSIGYVTTKYETSPNLSEYYNPINIYSHLGYWPEEYYRLGVVFIFQDDSLSPVYNLLGLPFSATNKDNFESFENFGKIDTSETFITVNEITYNTKGVFKMPNVPIQNHQERRQSTNPLCFKFNVDPIKEQLKEFKIKGLFFVRQARIPTILAQGLSMGIVDGTSTPALYDTKNRAYFTECFDSLKHQGCELTNHGTANKTGNWISKNGPECLALRQFERRVCYSNGEGCYDRDPNDYSNVADPKNGYTVNCRSILCADAYLNKSLQTIFDGSEFYIKNVAETDLKAIDDDKRLFTSNIASNTSNIYGLESADIAYMPENTPTRVINKQRFSSQCGSAEKASNIRSVHYKYFDSPNDFKDTSYNPNDDWFVDFVRGNFTSYLAVLNNKILSPGRLYNIYNINVNSENAVEMQIKTRGDDQTSFVRISDRYAIEDWDDNLEIFGGDCFTNTVSVKMMTNFIDPNTPTNEIIVDNHLFHNLDGKSDDSEDVIIIHKPTTDAKYRWIVKPSAIGWEKAQMGDWNAVDLGHWVTYKCLSNFNLGLRVENSQHVDEKARMGTNRSFYPMSGGKVSASTKVKDSDLLNAGLSTTLSARKYFEYQDLPYTKHMFDNRIAFSNVQIEDDFRNAYKIFQGMSYNDIERQYGSIVKLLEYGTDLFCVFEHGCAIIPINEKALMQTTTGQSIHMYGAGVLPEKVTPISTDYGSTWQESIVKTANGIYGVDAHAKKIWRFNAKGFSIISDTLVQRFLNDNILLTESDIQPTVGFKNIKTHYNAYKNDVMFTFYKGNKVWNLCYNERIEKWTTKYSWTPLCSENINNRFVSIDRERDKIYSFIYNNVNTEKGLHIVNENGNLFDNIDNKTSIIQDFNIVGYNSLQYVPKIKQIQFSYVENNEVKTETIDSNFEHDVDNRISKCSNLNLEIFVTDDSKVHCKIEPENLKLFSIIVDLELSYNNIKFDDTVAFLIDYNNLKEDDRVLYDLYIRNGLFIHGRSGVYDEINYFDCDLDNQIKPTFWYNKQEPFEFEFVVNQPTGIHKIFNNLVMISNNVEPDSLEIEIVGDVYGFDKEVVYKNENCEEHNHSLPKTEFVKMIPAKDKYYKTNVTWDPILNQYLLKTHQDVLNINDYGRRIGNIQYKEDVWYVTLQPIYHKLSGSSRLQSTRIRDKFARIRIKYKGDKLVIIHAIQTLANVSYS